MSDKGYIHSLFDTLIDSRTLVNMTDMSPAQREIFDNINTAIFLIYKILKDDVYGERVEE